MKFLLHDYAGHPFQVELSRELARRGYTVNHAYCASTITPRGSLEKRPADPDSFSIQSIRLKKDIAKQRFFERFQLESDYANRLVEACNAFQPDVVLSANTPSLVQIKLARWCRKHQATFGMWVQDLYGVAAHRLLSRKIPVLGDLVGRYFMSLDTNAARMSQAVIVITEDFVPFFRDRGIPEERVHVVPNWAPIEELPVVSRDNAWARENGLNPHSVRYLYSGTLSIRHNPELLVQLGVKLEEWGNGELIVVSQGEGIDYVRRRAGELNLKSVRCFPFQPFERMAEVFGSGDILVSILEADAGVFCVPSKVLSYMCAGRAQLVGIPLENLAARLVEQNRMGLICRPDDLETFLDNARKLHEDEALRTGCGHRAREYAEQHFVLEKICDRFESILGLKGSRTPELAKL